MIGFLINSIGKWQLGRRFLKLNRIGEALNLKAIQSAVLIMEINSEQELKEVNAFTKLLREENVDRVEVIGFSNDKELPEYLKQLKGKVFIKKEVSLLGIPKETFRYDYQS